MTQENPERPRSYYDEFTGDGRRFRLVRDEDESGVSGTGIVAVGIAFPSSGAAVLEWRNDSHGTDTTQNGLSIKPGPDGIRDTDEVHGHGGKTRIEWVDPPRSVREGDAVECPDCGAVIPVSEWTVYRNGGGACPACGRNHLPKRVRETQVETNKGTTAAEAAEKSKFESSGHETRRS